AILELEQVALNDELTVGTGIELAPTLELHLIDTRHGAFGNGLDRHAWLDGIQRLADGLVGIGGDGQGGSQAQGHGSEQTTHAHGNSWRHRSKKWARRLP